MDFYPTSFAMPKENERFEREIRKSKSPMWIYKPKNDYGGAGCYVYDVRMPEFEAKIKKDMEKRRNFVLQRYIENPLLIGGYKFHMRVFLYLESMDPPVGYIHHGAQVSTLFVIIIFYWFKFRSYSAQKSIRTTRQIWEIILISSPT